MNSGDSLASCCKIKLCLAHYSFGVAMMNSEAGSLSKKCLFLVFITALSLNNSTFAQTSSPRLSPFAPDPMPIKTMEPKNVPDFVDYNRQGGSALKTGLESATLPVETRLTLVVDYPVSAVSSVAGDIFEGHVRDDLFLGRTLILPRGSLVRGRVSDVNRPRWISRAGRVGLRLEQIVTPTGEVIPLDAALEFQKGMTNKQGQLDPGTNFGSRVQSSVRTVSGMNERGKAKGALVAANVATLGAPIIATAIGSSAVALFRSGDNISLTPGQEIEILLTNDLGVQVN